MEDDFSYKYIWAKVIGEMLKMASQGYLTNINFKLNDTYGTTFETHNVSLSIKLSQEKKMNHS